MGIVEPEQQIEASLRIDDLRDDLALQSDLDVVGRMFAVDAVQGQVAGPQFDLQLLDLHLVFDGRRGGQALHVLDVGHDLVGEAAQHVQIVAINLDGDGLETPDIILLSRS